MFFVCGRKPEDPEWTHADTERTCKLHTETSWEPRTFLLWGDSANHCTTVLPLSKSYLKKNVINSDILIAGYNVFLPGSSHWVLGIGYLCKRIYWNVLYLWLKQSQNNLNCSNKPHWNKFGTRVAGSPLTRLIWCFIKMPCDREPGPLSHLFTDLPSCNVEMKLQKHLSWLKLNIFKE